MRSIVFFIFLVLLMISCESESVGNAPEFLGEIEWQKNLGGSGDDVARSVIETSDGGYAVIGYTNSIDGDVSDKTLAENDFWVLKLNRDGEIEWQRTIGGSGDDKGRAIIETRDGGFAVTGPSMSADGDGSSNQGFHDHWLVKLDALGTIEWEQSFGFSGHDHSHSLFQTTDGGYFIGGYLDVTASEGAGNETISLKHGVGEFWAQKLDANGQLQWRRYFGGSNNDRIYKVLATHDDNYLLVGSSESDDFDISNTQGSYDVWLVKIDRQGNKLWERSYGGTGIDNGYGAVATIDGGYLIAGAAISDDGLISQPKGNSDAWLIKLDANGRVLWEKSYGGTGFDAAFDIAKAQQIATSYVVAGHTKSNDGDLTSNYGENDFWVFGIDQRGRLLFQKTLGGSGLDFAYGVAATADGKIVVVGETESSDFDLKSNRGGKDLWIAKIR